MNHYRFANDIKLSSDSAAIYGFHDTIHNYTKKGKLISHGLGHRVYYKRSEVENSIIKIEH